MLVKDFRVLNRRHEAIKELCNRFIPENSTIFEIGCGVGIITKHLQQRASNMVAVDISEENIRVAKMFASSPICIFEVVDIVENITSLTAMGKFQNIVLADTIEHIPKEKHAVLFDHLLQLLNPGGLIFITFPSPQYQAYLMDNYPETMQIIDEVVTINDLLACTSLDMLYFSYRDIWGGNQYIHLVLRNGIEYLPENPEIRTIFEKICFNIRNIKWRLRNYFFLKKLQDV